MVRTEETEIEEDMRRTGIKRREEIRLLKERAGEGKEERQNHNM